MATLTVSAADEKRVKALGFLSNKGTDNKVRFEITDYLDALYSDALVGSALAFSIDDYALNSIIFLCQLPGKLVVVRTVNRHPAPGQVQVLHHAAVRPNGYAVLVLWQDGEIIHDL